MQAAPQADSCAVNSTAAAYATLLLRTLGAHPASGLHAADRHPAIAWAESGLMNLTGQPDGAPRMCPVALASCADGALAALASLAPAGGLDVLRGSALLAERAAIMGLRRAGAVSPGGACRLYQAADGWIALNLARDDDWNLLPALLELSQVPTSDALPGLIEQQCVGSLLERGRWLGLALSAGQTPVLAPAGWFSVSATGRKRERETGRVPRVLDLSSLWAGPLCSHLLQQSGAEVIKVESPQRPDGARQGHPAFFDLLNAGKLCVAIDLRTAAGRGQLLAQIAGADIVIEGSRPRGLRQLGIDAAALVRERPGLTWLSITGYGRGEPGENWVAYGDDAAVAAGLSSLMHQATGLRLICGDAIADPLTGLHAALAAWASHVDGGGRLISLALRDVVAHCMAFNPPGSGAALRERQREWTALALRSGVREPSARVPATRARPLGADTDAVLSAPGLAC